MNEVPASQLAESLQTCSRLHDLLETDLESIKKGLKDGPFQEYQYIIKKELDQLERIRKQLRSL